MKRKNLSLKLAALLLACVGFGFASNFVNSASVYAMDGSDESNSSDSSSEDSSSNSSDSSSEDSSSNGSDSSLEDELYFEDMPYTDGGVVGYLDECYKFATGSLDMRYARCMWQLTHGDYTVFEAERFYYNPSFKHFMKEIYKKCGVAELLTSICSSIDSLNEYALAVNSADSEEKKKKVFEQYSGSLSSLLELPKQLSDCLKSMQAEYDKLLEKRSYYIDEEDFKKVKKMFRFAAMHNLVMLQTMLRASKPTIYAIFMDDDSLKNVRSRQRWTGFIKKLYSFVYGKSKFGDIGLQLYEQDRAIMENFKDQEVLISKNNEFDHYTAQERMLFNSEKERKAIEEGRKSEKILLSSKLKNDLNKMNNDYKNSILNSNIKNIQILKKNYKKELESYPGLELFPEDAKLVHLGEKGKETQEEAHRREQLREVREFNKTAGISGMFDSEMSDEEYLNSAFFDSDVLRYNEYLKENYPFIKNLRNKNLRNLRNLRLEGRLADIPDEYLKRFRDYVESRMKDAEFVESTSYNNVDFAKVYFEKYINEYRAYLEKNKAEVEPKPTNLNTNPVATAPINAIKNNVGDESSANLELPANINEASADQLRRFRDFLFKLHIASFIIDPNDDVDQLKEAVGRYYDKYAGEYNKTIKK